MARRKKGSRAERKRDRIKRKTTQPTMESPSDQDPTETQPSVSHSRPLPERYITGHTKHPPATVLGRNPGVQLYAAKSPPIKKVEATVATNKSRVVEASKVDSEADPFTSNKPVPVDSIVRGFSFRSYFGCEKAALSVSEENTSAKKSATLRPGTLGTNNDLGHGPRVASGGDLYEKTGGYSSRQTTDGRHTLVGTNYDGWADRADQMDPTDVLKEVALEFETVFAPTFEAFLQEELKKTTGNLSTAVQRICMKIFTSEDLPMPENVSHYISWREISASTHVMALTDLALEIMKKRSETVRESMTRNLSISLAGILDEDQVLNSSEEHRLTLYSDAAYWLYCNLGHLLLQGDVGDKPENLWLGYYYMNDQRGGGGGGHLYYIFFEIVKALSDQMIAEKALEQSDEDEGLDFDDEPTLVQEIKIPAPARMPSPIPKPAPTSEQAPASEPPPASEQTPASEPPPASDPAPEVSFVDIYKPSTPVPTPPVPAEDVWGSLDRPGIAAKESVRPGDSGDNGFNDELRAVIGKLDSRRLREPIAAAPMPDSDDQPDVEDEEVAKSLEKDKGKDGPFRHKADKNADSEPAPVSESAPEPVPEPEPEVSEVKKPKKAGERKRKKKRPRLVNVVVPEGIANALKIEGDDRPALLEVDLSGRSKPEPQTTPPESNKEEESRGNGCSTAVKVVMVGVLAVVVGIIGKKVIDDWRSTDSTQPAGAAQATGSASATVGTVRTAPSSTAVASVSTPSGKVSTAPKTTAAPKSSATPTTSATPAPIASVKPSATPTPKSVPSSTPGTGPKSAPGVAPAKKGPGKMMKFVMTKVKPGSELERMINTGEFQVKATGGGVIQQIKRAIVEGLVTPPSTPAEWEAIQEITKKIDVGSGAAAMEEFGGATLTDLRKRQAIRGDKTHKRHQHLKALEAINGDMVTWGEAHNDADRDDEQSYYMDHVENEMVQAGITGEDETIHRVRVGVINLKHDGGSGNFITYVADYLAAAGLEDTSTKSAPIYAPTPVTPDDVDKQQNGDEDNRKSPNKGTFLRPNPFNRQWQRQNPHKRDEMHMIPENHKRRIDGSRLGFYDGDEIPVYFEDENGNDVLSSTFGGYKRTDVEMPVNSGFGNDKCKYTFWDDAIEKAKAGKQKTEAPDTTNVDIGFMDAKSKRPDTLLTDMGWMLPESNRPDTSAVDKNWNLPPKVNMDRIRSGAALYERRLNQDPLNVLGINPGPRLKGGKDYWRVLRNDVTNNCKNDKALGAALRVMNKWEARKELGYAGKRDQFLNELRTAIAPYTGHFKLAGQDWAKKGGEFDNRAELAAKSAARAAAEEAKYPLLDTEGIFEVNDIARVWHVPRNHAMKPLKFIEDAILSDLTALEKLNKPYSRKLANIAARKRYIRLTFDNMRIAQKQKKFLPAHPNKHFTTYTLSERDLNRLASIRGTDPTAPLPGDPLAAMPIAKKQGPQTNMERLSHGKAMHEKRLSQDPLNELRINVGPRLKGGKDYWRVLRNDVNNNCKNSKAKRSALSVLAKWEAKKGAGYAGKREQFLNELRAAVAAHAGYIKTGRTEWAVKGSQFDNRAELAVEAENRARAEEAEHQPIEQSDVISNNALKSVCNVPRKHAMRPLKFIEDSILKDLSWQALQYTHNRSKMANIMDKSQIVKDIFADWNGDHEVGKFLPSHPSKKTIKYTIPEKLHDKIAKAIGKKLTAPSERIPFVDEKDVKDWNENDDIPFVAGADVKDWHKNDDIPFVSGTDVIDGHHDEIVELADSDLEDWVEEREAPEKSGIFKIARNAESAEPKKRGVGSVVSWFRNKIRRIA